LCALVGQQSVCFLKVLFKIIICSFTTQYLRKVLQFLPSQILLDLMTEFQLALFAPNRQVLDLQEAGYVNIK